MSWKKNVFSCLVWAIYLLIIGTVMVFIGSAICDSIGAAVYIGSIAAAGYLLSAGIVVFSLHKIAVNMKGAPRSRGKMFLWTEVMMTAALMAAGLFLRVALLRASPEGSVFFDLAYVSSETQVVPLFTHGAVYFYIRTLRILFILLGNKAAAALGLQLVLQMSGALILYFAVRKMTGRIPAVVMMSFFMLSSYMVERTVFVSPEMLYLFIFSLVLLYVSRGVDRVRGWGFWLLAGVMAAFLIYLDVAGLLLIPLMLGVIFAKRQDVKRKISGAVAGGAAGLLTGAAICVSTDALSSSKPVLSILEAWLQLYRFSEPQFAITLYDFSTVWLITLLLCFMAWGIFSFWCNRKAERFSIWILCLLIAALMQCLGIFTEEMSGAVYIFFFSTILAGLSVKESVAVPEAEGTGKRSNKKKAVASDFELEELDEENQTEGEEKETVEADKKSQENQDQTEPEKKREIEYIENPLPLPKKHVRRVMDYALDPKPDSEKNLDGYDIYVSDDDDFDH